MNKPLNKTKVICFAMICMLLFSITGCTNQMESGNGVIKCAKNEYLLYFVSIDSTRLVPVNEKFDKKESVEKQIQQMCNRLTKVHSSIEYKSIMPEQVTFQGFSYNDSGLVTIDVSGKYYDAVPSTQILCRAAFVNTLTQIKEVNAVDFTVDTQPMMDADESVGTLTADSFVDNDTKAESSQVQNVTLYFSDVTGSKLEPLQIPINVGTNVSAEQLIIEQLIAGTHERGYYNTIPSQTKLLSVSTKDGVCYVDFSKEFMNMSKNVKDQIVIYSVVNSLCELSTVSKVSFTIEGEQQLLYNGNVLFNQLFERNLDLVDGNGEKESGEQDAE